MTEKPSSLADKNPPYTTNDLAEHLGVTPDQLRRYMYAAGIRAGAGNRHYFKTLEEAENVIELVKPRVEVAAATRLANQQHDNIINSPQDDFHTTEDTASQEAEPAPDSEEAAMTNEETRSNLKDSIKKRSTWLRGLYMLLFMIVWGLAELLVFTVIVFQFISMALSGKTNGRLLTFGRNLSAFVYEILMYLTYNREDKPFPFSDWPSLKDPTDAADGDGQTTRTG